MIISGKYWSKAWSLVEGCTPISPACDNCWLKAMNHRFKTEIALTDGGVLNLTDDDGNWSGDVISMVSRLDLPMKTKKPTIFAVWSDLFHEAVPVDFIIEAFERMEYCEQHTFLVLSKRPERMLSVLYGQEGNFYLGGGDYMPNVWLGTTVENQEMADKRIPELIECAPGHLFLSIEPMLGPVKIFPHYSKNINQVICGGETGRNARRCNPDWVRSLRDQCKAAGVRFFLKKIGKSRELDGTTHDDLAWRLNGMD